MSESISWLPVGTMFALTDIFPVTQGSTGPGTGTTRYLSGRLIFNGLSLLPGAPGGIQPTDSVVMTRTGVAYQASPAALTAGIFAAPPAIGSSVPAGGAFTTLAASGAATLSAGATVTGGMTVDTIDFGNSDGMKTILYGSGTNAVGMFIGPGEVGVAMAPTNFFSIRLGGTAGNDIFNVSTADLNYAGIANLGTVAVSGTLTAPVVATGGTAARSRRTASPTTRCT